MEVDVFEGRDCKTGELKWTGTRIDLVFGSNFGLNDVLLSAIAASKSEKYGKPNDAFTRLAEEYRPCVM